MVTIQEAPSTKRVVTKEDVLRLIIKRMINKGDYLFYQEYLGREYVLGTVGDRGGGKSGSDAVIAIVDFMLRGKPVWSNMKIACDITVEDEIAREVGLNSGGTVHYESIDVEKDKLLELDETYRKGCLVIEEINVQYANVRRFMTNTNLAWNEVCQQLRKFQTSLIYNVIDEMFVDSQLRALTDIFIRTYDTAFDVDKMARKKKPGLDFCWRVYAYSGYLNGEQGKYSLTKKPDKVYFRFAPWRGVYDSMQHQEKGVYSLNKREMQAAEKAENNEWHWLEEKAIKIRNTCIERGVASITSEELTQVIERPLTRTIREALRLFGISYNTHSQSYSVNLFKIEEGETDTEGAARN